MDLFLGALIASTLKGLGSALSELGNYEDDKQSFEIYEDQQKRYKQRLRDNLETTRKSNAVSAMAGAVDRVLSDINNSASVEANQQNYSKRLTQYTDQYADQVGSSLAVAGTTGFRRSGSNLNKFKKASRVTGYSLDYLRFNMNQSIEEEGYNSLQKNISGMDAMAGYRFNIKNAILQTQAQIDEADSMIADRRKELGIDDFWGRIGTSFLGGFVGSAIDYGADALITKAESAGGSTK